MTVKRSHAFKDNAHLARKNSRMLMRYTHLRIWLSGWVEWGVNNRFGAASLHLSFPVQSQSDHHLVQGSPDERRPHLR